MEDEVEALIATLTSKRGGPAMRSQAARLLGASADPRAIQPLLDQIEETVNPFKVPVVTAVLEVIPQFGAVVEPALLALLDNPDDSRRRYVPRLLSAAIGTAAAPVLVRLLRDSDPEVVMNAATSLGMLHEPTYLPVLQELLNETDQPSLLRGVAASALGMTGNGAAYEILVPLLASPDDHLVAGAIDGLAELGDPRIIPLLEAVLASGRLAENTARGARLALISLRARR